MIGDNFFDQIVINIFKSLNVSVILFEYKYMGNHLSTDELIVETLNLSKFSKLKNHVEVSLRKRIEELATLNEIGRAISSATKINELIQLIYQQTTRIMDVSAFYLALYDKKKNEMQIIYDVLNGKRQRSEENTRKFGKGRTEYIIRTKKPLLANHSPQETYRKLGIISSDKKAKACVGVPLMYGNNAIGALVVQSYTNDDAYSQGHINLLTTIANQAAIAIENARLFEKLQEELAVRKKIEKSLKERNIELIQAKKDTDNILNNVKDGLFVINKDLKIGSRYSASLEKIFEKKSLSGKSILAYLRHKVPGKIITTFKDYLSLLFDPSIDGDSLQMLNPLSQIKMNFMLSPTKPVSKYLTFDFRRIYNNSGISDIIVSVNDVTEQVTMAKNLEESKEQSKKHMEWLFTILNVDSQMLKEFMMSSEEEIGLIKQLIENDNVQASIDIIYRSIHLIKGNASMLGMDFVADQAHRIEESLVLLRGNKSGKREIQQNLLGQLEEFFMSFNHLKNLIERIGNFHVQFRPTRKHESDLLFKSLSNLLKTLSKRYNKEIYLDHSAYNSAIVPHQHRLLIRDILVQLSRNSIYHGIEGVDERLKKNKDRKGCIQISNSLNDQYFNLSHRDDGRGLQINQIKQMAIQAGIKSQSQINKLSKKKIIDLIFLPGLTTSAEADITAGRGIGMDIIKNKVEKIGGSIQIESTKDIFTKFTITLPVKK